MIGSFVKKRNKNVKQPSYEAEFLFSDNHQTMKNMWWWDCVETWQPGQKKKIYLFVSLIYSCDYSLVRRLSGQPQCVPHGLRIRFPSPISVTMATRSGNAYWELHSTQTCVLVYTALHYFRGTKFCISVSLSALKKLLCFFKTVSKDLHRCYVLKDQQVYKNALMTLSRTILQHIFTES